jgi:hypothetical protein
MITNLGEADREQWRRRRRRGGRRLRRRGGGRVAGKETRPQLVAASGRIEGVR